MVSPAPVSYAATLAKASYSPLHSTRSAQAPMLHRLLQPCLQQRSRHCDRPGTAVGDSLVVDTDDARPGHRSHSGNLDV
eukprot:30435-Eustigmatos_ZCMA.PRE.1